MSTSGLADIAARWRRLNLWMRLGAVAGLVLITATVVILAGAPAGAEEPGLSVEPSTATPTPTATATPSPTPTPEPTPTPDPDAPVPAATIEPGGQAGLTNPSSQGFGPPPAEDWAPASPNDAGVLRMVSSDLGIDHAVDTLGVTDGRLDSPGAEEGSHAVGWYASSGGYEFGVPARRGNAIFSAHETWNHMQGPFYNLHRAHIGDEIFLDMANGERRHYQVASVTRYPVSTMPMAEILWPSERPEGEEWITLYTCGGEIVYGDDGFGDYLARDVLVAKWVGSSLPRPEPTAPADPDYGPPGLLDVEVEVDVDLGVDVEAGLDVGVSLGE